MANNYNTLQHLLTSASFDPDVWAVAESVALTHPSLRPAVAQSPGLTPASWDYLFAGTPLPRATLCTSLYARPLDPTQLARVVAKEHRYWPIRSLLSHNRVDPAAQLTLAAHPRLDNSAAYFLLGRFHHHPIAGSLSEPARRQLAQRFGGLHRLYWLATTDRAYLPRAEAEKLVLTFSSWALTPRGSQDENLRNHLITALIERRPELLPIIVAAGQTNTSLLDAAADSRHLTDPRLQRQVAGIDLPHYPSRAGERATAIANLARNPVTHTSLTEELWAELKSTPLPVVITALRGRRRRKVSAVTDSYGTVGDPAQLDWLIARCAPRSIRSRPFDIAALASNPHLDAGHAQRIWRSLRAWNHLSTLPYPEINRAIPAYNKLHSDNYIPPQLPTPAPPHPSQWVPTARFDRSLVGSPDATAMASYLSSRLTTDQNRWEAFFALAPDFEGTTEALVDICTLIHSPVD